MPRRPKTQERVSTYSSDSTRTSPNTYKCGPSCCPSTENNSSICSHAEEISFIELPPRAMNYLISIDRRTLRPKLVSLKNAKKLDKIPLKMRVIDFRHDPVTGVDVVHKELPTSISIEHESYVGTGC